MSGANATGERQQGRGRAVSDQKAGKKKPEARKKNSRESPLFVASTEKVFQVLHAFGGPEKQMPLSRIAEIARLDRSATQRVVYTLETLGYLRRIPNTRNYAPTSRLLQFGYDYLRGNELVSRASPYLLEVSRTVGETVSLHEMDGHEIVYVARFPGKHLLNVDIMVGTRLPAIFTASGTAMLSTWEPDRLEEVLQAPARPLTPLSLTDPDKLRARIVAARDRGYAIISNETVLGDISVASSITDRHGRAVAGISIAVPETRWSPERVEQDLVKQVQLAAASLSEPRFIPA